MSKFSSSGRALSLKEATRQMTRSSETARPRPAGRASPGAISGESPWRWGPFAKQRGKK